MMNNEEIDKLIAELEKLKTPESQEIEIPPCGWWFNNKGSIFKSAAPTDDLKYGFKRTTREACKLASKRMIRVNRLSLLAHILGVERKFVSEEYNYYVYWSHNSNVWDYCFARANYAPDRVYMTKEGAESIATILNNNEWDLEVNDEH